MADIFDFNAQADQALVGGRPTSDAMGVTNSMPPAGPPPEVMRSRQVAAGAIQDFESLMRSRAPTQPDVIVGYDSASGKVFSAGREFNIDSNLEALTALQEGYLDRDNQQLPPGYSPTRASEIKSYIAKIPDYQKEFQAGVKNYGANMALLGSEVTGSQGLRETYSRLSSEADLLAGASASPQSWDEVKFGENMLPYVRRLGLGSIPYVAEALIGGFGFGVAFRGVGTAAAKQMAAGAIARETERVLANSIVNGVAQISREQAILQAAKNVGTTLARSAGVVAGTYPSAVGDVLSNQMDQAGETNLGAAAAAGVPYAGLNLLGGEGLIAGTSRMINRATGASTIARPALRYGAGVGLVTAGEAFNEFGQEVANQAGRMAVDPEATLTSPEALGRYKEAAIGGAALGFLPGQLAGASAAYRGPEAPVTPMMGDANRQAELARYEISAARDGMEQDRLAGTGGPEFVGPQPPAPPEPVVETPQVDPDFAWLASEYGREKLGRLQTKLVEEAKAAGIDIRSVEAEPLRHAIDVNNGKAARKIIKEAANVRNAVPAGPVAPGDGGQPGVDAVGGAPDGQRGFAGVAGGDQGVAGGADATGGENLPVGDGAGQRAAPVGRRRVASGRPDFELTTYRPDEGPSARPAEPVEQVTPTDKLRDRTGGQVPLWILPSGRRVVRVAQAPVSGAEAQWNKIKSREMPMYRELPEELRAEVDAMQAEGKLNRGELAKRLRAAMEERRQEVTSAAARAEPEVNIPPEESQQWLRRLQMVFPYGDAGVLHRAYVMGVSAKDIATGLKKGANAVNQQISRSRKNADILIGKAVEQGRLSAEDGRKMRALLERKPGRYRTQLEPIVEEAPAAEEIQVEEGRAPVARLEGEEKADAVADEGAAATLPEGTDAVESSGTSTAGADTRPQMSDADVAKLPAREAAAVMTARGLLLMDRASQMELQLEGNTVDESKVADMKQQADSLRQRGMEYMQQAEQLLRRQAKADSQDVRRDKGKNRGYQYTAEDEDPGEIEYGKATVARNPYTAAQLRAELRKFIRGDLGARVTIVDSINDFKNTRDLAIGIANGTAFGWTRDGKAVLVANRIERGTARSKFMHEVGAHLGLEGLMSAGQQADLARQVIAWADANDGSQESMLARRALERVAMAGTPDEDIFAEVNAYFVEEAVQAGVEPSATKGASAVEVWLAKLWDAFEKALLKLGFDMRSMNAQDLVDLAYGAAQMALSETETSGSPVRFGKNSIAARLPAPLQTSGQDIGATMRSWGQSALNTLAFTEDLITRAVDKGVASAARYKETLDRRATKAGERERAAIKVLEPYTDLSSAQQRAANQFLYDSTREGKWGFKPDWEKDVQIDATLAARFSALPASTQDFIKGIFRHGAQILADKKRMVEQTVGAEFDADIAAAKEAGRTGLAKQLQESKDSMLARFATLFRIRQGMPYAPLRREGDWLVVGKSEEYLKAERAGDTKRVGELETDPDHYYVSFAETEARARQLERELQAEGLQAVYRPKEAMVEQLYGGSSVMGAFLKIKNQLEQLSESSTSDEDQSRLNQLHRIVTNMYLNALGEASARKAEMRRRGIAGDIDMIRGFGSQARADAQFMASVEFNDRMMKAITAMRKESKSGASVEQTEKMKIFNELMKRHVATIEDVKQPVADRITRATSVWMLATSPAYYLINLTQPFVMSTPFMAKQHSYGAASTELVKAWGQVAKLIPDAKLMKQLDYDSVPADVRAPIKELVELGIIDIGMDTEMGAFQLEERGAFSKAWNKVDTTIRVVAQKVEAINRLSTAIAAYRLEFARTGDAAQARVYAGKVVTQTHGDYSRANAPRMFNNGLGRVALQFRKFQLIQLTLIAKMFKEVLTGSPQERIAAARALSFIAMHMGVLGGLVAMPGYALWNALAGLMLGDEGPDDLEQQLRKAIGNQTVADLLLRGVPAGAGMDISGKIGMSNVLSILPFTDINFSDRKSVTEIGYALLTGPTGALALRGSDAWRYTRQGDYYKALENVMPSGVMNAMRGYRFATAGVTNPRGDVLVSASEMDALKGLIRGMGFSPTSESRRMALQQYSYDVDTYFRERSAQLKLEYTRAVRSGQSPAPVIRAWSEMQAAQRAKGVRATPIGQLFRAPTEAQRRERDTAGGVQFRRTSADLVRQGAEL